jgi:hypothetical protein
MSIPRIGIVGSRFVGAGAIFEILASRKIHLLRKLKLISNEDPHFGRGDSRVAYESTFDMETLLSISAITGCEYLRSMVVPVHDPDELGGAKWIGCGKPGEEEFRAHTDKLCLGHLNEFTEEDRVYAFESRSGKNKGFSYGCMVRGFNDLVIDEIYRMAFSFGMQMVRGIGKLDSGEGDWIGETDDICIDVDNHAPYFMFDHVISSAPLILWSRNIRHVASSVVTLTFITDRAFDSPYNCLYNPTDHPASRIVIPEAFYLPRHKVRFFSVEIPVPSDGLVHERYADEDGSIEEVRQWACEVMFNAGCKGALEVRFYDRFEFPYAYYMSDCNDVASAIEKFPNGYYSIGKHAEMVNMKGIEAFNRGREAARKIIEGEIS